MSNFVGMTWGCSGSFDSGLAGPQFPADVNALNGTDSAPICKFTVLFELATPVAVPVTVNGNVLVPPPTLPPVATIVYSPSGTVWPALSVPFQVKVLFPATAVAVVS